MCLRKMRVVLLTLMTFTAAACSSGAVVFAPTPSAPDLSPVLYTHPSGAFSVVLPGQWAIYEQNTTTLAATAFTPPSTSGVSLLFAVINMGRTLTETELSELITRYQTQVRGDIGEYTERSRDVLSDGSWRMTGYRQVVGGVQQVNTFMQHDSGYVGLIEVALPENADSAGIALLEPILNTFEMQPGAVLDTAAISTLGFAKTSRLALLHVTSWTTPTGVFFITGEVGNYGTTSVRDLPVQAQLLNADGRQISGAADTAFGYGIPPGGFAPFSLRFGEGQPGEAVDYALILGGADWTPAAGNFAAADALTWTDSSSFDGLNRLIVRGDVTNTGTRSLRGVRAILTVFNDAQSVIGAGAADAQPGALAPGESGLFEIVLPELGDIPANYIVSVQALPDTPVIPRTPDDS